MWLEILALSFLLLGKGMVEHTSYVCTATTADDYHNNAYMSSWVSYVRHTADQNTDTNASPPYIIVSYLNRYIQVLY
jgi:hypothetical protein